jgi:hypothetical protein
MASTRQNPKVYEAKRLEPGQSVVLDGCGGDPGWQSARVLADFSFPWTKRTRPAAEFRAFWDDLASSLISDVQTLWLHLRTS